MYKIIHISFMLILSIEAKVSKSSEDDRSSLVFVFDTTGSMFNDLKQLREGAEMILNTALKQSDIIADFVFVPFHDPGVGPATVTHNKTVFQAALNIVRVYGGGDCPEKSLTGLQLALNVSRPRSFVYVFTDATAHDHRLVGKVLDLVQRKQSQVVFVLTGHCNDLERPSYLVYQQIAAASSGQVFNLNKTNVHKVLDFVRSSIKARSVNLGTMTNPAGYNYTREIPVDSTLGEVTVSVSGSKPQIHVFSPTGEQLTGPPRLVTTLDLAEIMVVKVLQPEPGNWSITVGSEAKHSVKVVGLSNLTFHHGFSVQRPSKPVETSYRPLQGAYNYMMLSLTEADRAVRVSHAEILALNGSTLFEIPLTEVDRDSTTYLAEAFIPPNELFYIAINGVDEDNQELRRVGATAIQAKAPDVPYLTAPKKVPFSQYTLTDSGNGSHCKEIFIQRDPNYKYIKIRAFRHETVTLECDVESLVPVNVFWTKDGAKIQPQISSLQSTSVQHVITDMTEDDAGSYGCVARNVAGVSQVTTEVEILAEPPVVTMSASNTTLVAGEELTIYCSVVSDTALDKYQLIFIGNGFQNETEISVAPNDGVYQFNRTIQNVHEEDSGVYSCVAAHKGGEASKSLNITVTNPPTAQILGPHTLPKALHSSLQLVCVVEHCSEMQWLHNNVVVERRRVNGSENVVLDTEVDGDGVWMCIALEGDHKVSDSVQVIALIKPEVEIEGDKNVTLLNGTEYSISCLVKAKPEPRILWHMETERFLNNTVSVLSPNVYRSVLKLDSKTSRVNRTYFCFGENSEGIHQDSVTVSVRTPMKLIQGFSDISTQLYSNITMACQIDSYPSSQIKWYHNNTELSSKPNLERSENNSTITIKRVDFDDLGFYMCKASNRYEELLVNGTLSVYGLEAPLLFKEPISKVSKKGETTNITCSVVKGNPKPTFKWEFLSDVSEAFGELPSDVTTTNRSEVTISIVKLDHAGVYRCAAKNVLGRDYYDIRLTVLYPPEIESNEESDEALEIEAGQQVVLSCQAQGFPKPLVTWTKDQMPVSYTKNVYLTTDNNLVIEKATEDDTGLFTCNASSVLGFTLKNFTVVVYVPPKITPPGIEPEPQQFVEGQLVELPCQAVGSPKPEVRWLQNGNEVTEDRKYVDEFGLRFVANLTDFGEYTCIVNNKYGNSSVNYTVFIWVPPSIESSLQTKTNVLIGSDVSLTCDAVGFPVPVIYWEFNGTVLKENYTNISFNEYGTINITNASSKQEGLYACIAENFVGVARKEYNLHINEPPRILDDNYTGPYIATEKDTLLKVSCKAVGKPRPYALWVKDDVYLDKDSRYDIDMDGTLTIRNPSEDLSGLYTCISKNKVGTANKTVAVEIYPLPTKIQADESVSTVTVIEGTNASVQCPVRARNSTVTWYKDAKLLSHGQLSLPNISRDNDSTYACVCANAVGSTHTNVRVNVEWPPRFIEEGARELLVVRGGDKWLECGVDAKPSARTKWMFNSRVMLGEENDRLRLINLQLHHTGVYKCIVSNKHGTIVRQFRLDVLVPPFISEFDLLDVQLKEGMNATLECNAEGSPIPDIQWTFSNSNWQVVNSSLTTSNASVTSEGLFECAARNIAGAARLVYRVAVVAPAAVEEIAVYDEGRGGTVDRGAELVVGSKARISCKAAGRPTPKIQWIKNGILLSENLQEISYADLTFDNVNTSSSGVYSCVASNEGGMGDRRIKVDVIEPPKIFQTLFHNSNSTERQSKLEVISGQAFHLHCHPYGNPMPEVYWFKDGVPLKLFDDSMVSTDFGEVIHSRSARYEQSGNYTCVARSSVGNASVVYLVDVLVPPPTPKEASRSVSTRAGEPLTLSCPVEGSPAPYVSWIKQPYTDIDNSSRLTLSEDNVTLTIQETETSDSGLYSCVMTNKVGTTEVMFDVIIEKPPSIAGNVGANISETRVVPLRRSLVLKCEVDGHPAPKITWLKDTLQLSNSSSNIHQVLRNSLLAVWSASPRDAGQYVCVAENRAGTAHRRYYVMVQVPGKWSGWSQWSYCNATCGLGHQVKTRLCQYVDDYVTVDERTTSDRIILDQSTCKGPRTEQRRCHMPPCEDDDTPHWSGWGRWSSCSSSCGAGTQARARRCRAGRCRGDNVQIRKCPDLPKCDSLENDVLNTSDSNDEDFDNDPYTPEATFEFEPEVVNAEEFYIRPVKSQPPLHAAPVSPTAGQGPCAPGYSHNDTTHTCEDIDECLIDSNHCHLTQMCVNTPGGYQCGCQPGYTSIGAGQRCLDINECQLDIDGCEYACVNVAGGYVCACPRHLRLHADKHHCYQASSNRNQYTNPESEYLSAMIEYPSKHKNSRN